MSDASAVDQAHNGHRTGFLAWWHRTPLYIRIVGALLLGVGVGLALGEKAHFLEIPSKIILRLLGALAPPLILIAVIYALMTADIRGRVAGKLVALLSLNTFIAIIIGLVVANVLRPGSGAHLAAPTSELKLNTSSDPLTQFLDNVPKSLFGPLTDNGSVIGVIFIAVSFGIALRGIKRHPPEHLAGTVVTLERLVELAMAVVLRVLHWLIDLVPLGVFGIVASIIGTKGFAPFVSLGKFIVAVLVGLSLQTGWYLLRVRFGSWVRPLDLLRGCRDALIMAFSTGSSTVTMPVTFASLKNRVGLREESASMGSLVGANFNNDGTALYEAMSALFVAQLLGMNLSLTQQLLVVLTSIVASVGAAGIPEAGLVTMTLVFSAVGLPTRYIAILLTVDWFLDRCRTMINVMGDMNVSCLLDGKIRGNPDPHLQEIEAALQ